jgi:hypothetical protein
MRSSWCVSVYSPPTNPSSVRQQLGKHVLVATNTHTTEQFLEILKCKEVWLYERSKMNI